MPGPLPNNPHDYSTRGNERQAERRREERLTESVGLQVTTGSEVVKPLPDETWETKLAKEVWTIAQCDEAARERWGTGDYLALYALCEFVDRSFGFNADGSPRKVGPDTMRVVLQGFSDLQLTDSSKKRLGWFVDREPDPGPSKVEATLIELDAILDGEPV